MVKAIILGALYGLLAASLIMVALMGGMALLNPQTAIGRNPLPLIGLMLLWLMMAGAPGAFLLSILISVRLDFLARRNQPRPVILRTAVRYGSFLGFVNLVITMVLLDPHPVGIETINPLKMGYFLAPALLGGVGLGLGAAD